eukprot:7902037-Pyramimonas_sp.AAC.1
MCIRDRPFIAPDRPRDRPASGESCRRARRMHVRQDVAGKARRPADQALELLEAHKGRVAVKEKDKL